MNRLKQLLCEAEQELETLRDAKAEYCCQISNLNSELQRVQRCLDDCNKENCDMNEQLREQETIICSLQTQLDDANCQLVACTGEKGCLEEKLKQAVCELEEMCNINKNLEECVQDLKEELEHTKE